MKKIFLSIAFAFVSMFAAAQSWDEITMSGNYYYGVGSGETQKEAMDQALSEMTSMIATHVSNDFTHIADETTTNGEIDSKSRVLNCIKTYSQATLTNVQTWPVENPPKPAKFAIRCYMKRSELARIFEGRVAMAKYMIERAESALEKRKIDTALQYYYWAYTLIRSVQFPAEVTDEKGRKLVSYLPMRIEEVLDDVDVQFAGRDEELVDLLFTYKGEPVANIDFTYNDGRARCVGNAKDGRGMIEMMPEFSGDVCHLSIEYEYINQAQGDAEMQSVLNVIPKKVISAAAKKVRVVDFAQNVSVASKEEKIEMKAQEIAVRAVEALKVDKPMANMAVADNSAYTAVLDRVLAAMNKRNFLSVATPDNFTDNGLEVFQRLISYGNGRVVGTPDMQFFKSYDGTVVARGLQMSFSDKSGTKKTFVEDVVFSFSNDGKIDNVAFGMGVDVTNTILTRKAAGWSAEARAVLLEFLENYKTAYCLERHDYISTIFSDDAVIITGRVLKNSSTPGIENDVTISDRGREIIKYNEFDKDSYLKHLRRVFARNNFINLRFSDLTVQKLTKFKDKEIYAVQMGQEYNSSTYGDRGYLYLQIDMTNKEEPLIKIRTWQPNEVDLGKIYSAGDFFTD